MANQPGINIYHLRANTHRRAFDSRTVKIIYRWIVASTRFGISERGGARILSCAHQPLLLSAIPVRPRYFFLADDLHLFLHKRVPVQFSDIFTNHEYY